MSDQQDMLENKMAMLHNFIQTSERYSPKFDGDFVTLWPREQTINVNYTIPENSNRDENKIIDKDISIKHELYKKINSIGKNEWFIDENLMEYLPQFQKSKKISNNDTNCRRNDRASLNFIRDNPSQSVQNQVCPYGEFYHSSSNTNRCSSYYDSHIKFNPREEKNMPTKDKVENWLEMSGFIKYKHIDSESNMSIHWEENEFDFQDSEYFSNDSFSFGDYQDIIYLQSRKIDSLVRKAYLSEQKARHHDSFDSSTLSSE